MKLLISDSMGIPAISAALTHPIFEIKRPTGWTGPSSSVNSTFARYAAEGGAFERKRVEASFGARGDRSWVAGTHRVIYLSFMLVSICFMFDSSVICIKRIVIVPLAFTDIPSKYHKIGCTFIPKHEISMFPCFHAFLSHLEVTIAGRSAHVNIRLNLTGIRH